MENRRQSEMEALFIHFQSTCNGQEKQTFSNVILLSQRILETGARMTLTILYFLSVSIISQISNFTKNDDRINLIDCF